MTISAASSGGGGKGPEGPMRILYSHYLADDDHPAARMVQAIARELVGLGHAVQVHRCLGPSQPGSVEAAVGPDGPRPRTAPHPLVAAIKGRLWFARTLAENRGLRNGDRAAIAAFRPDVVLAREDAYRTSIVHEARAARVPLVTYADVPVAYESRTFHTHRWHPPGVVEQIERWWIKSSRGVITPAGPAGEELARYGLHVPIHIVPNGVNPERFPELDAQAKRRCRQTLGIPADSLVVGYQGSFRNFHGIDLLCDLIRATAGRPGTHWLLVGDGPERFKVMEAVATNPSVTVLGRQPPDRMGDLVGVMDVGISTHVLFQGPFYLCPLKILEYASAGCAVIASAQGDIPRMLDEGRVGVLVDRPEPTAWVAALQQLLDEPDRITALGRSARRWVLEHLTWRNTAEGVAAVLESALQHPPSERGSRDVGPIAQAQTRRTGRSTR